MAHRNQSVALQGQTITVPSSNSRVGLDGNPAIIEIRPIQLGEQTLIIVAEIALSSALDLAINTVNILLGILAISLLAAAVISLVVTNHFVKPIQQMEQVAKKSRRGI